MSSRAARWLGREIAIGLAAPMTNVAADGYAIADNGYVAAEQAYRGTRGLGRVVVGGEFWHGGGDRKNALAQIGTDFITFRNDLTATAGPEDATWIAADVAPTFAEWQNFVARMAESGIASYVTEWSVFESWAGRLKRLREAARARGIHLESPEPEALPQTVWQRGATGTGSSLDVWIAAGKTAVFGAIAITGTIAFFSILKDLHGLAQKRWAR